jgi:hypothetical protein
MKLFREGMVELEHYNQALWRWRVTSLFLDWLDASGSPSPYSPPLGAIAQLVERVNGIHEVRSSILLGSTIFLFLRPPQRHAEQEHGHHPRQQDQPDEVIRDGSLGVGGTALI